MSLHLGSHPQPITKCYSVPVTLGAYSDYVWWDVLPMGMGYIILRHPRDFMIWMKIMLNVPVCIHFKLSQNVVVCMLL